jgi:hypothetical protein
MGSDKKYDLSFLNKLSNADENFIRDMILTFKRTSPKIVLKMEKYLKSGNYKALGNEAHRLIPGILFLGAKKIEKDLVKIEKYINENNELDKIPALLRSVKRSIEELIIQFNIDYNIK